MSIPVRHRIVSSVRETDRVINVLVDVDTDEGASGISYVAGFTPHTAMAICALLDGLAEVVHGCDATMIGHVWDRMWRACTLVGHAGVSTFALSAIDTALWDLQGKLLGVPLHRLLGTRRTTLQAYASDGCWLQEDPVRTADEAAGFSADGFKAVKVRLGRRDPEQDLATLDAVRRAVGSSTSLIADVNQGWSRDRARRYGPRLAEHDVEWLEEPLPAEDIEGMAQLRREIPVPLAAGENAYMLDGVRALIDAAAVSVIIPDLQRVGGVTGWIRAGALAEARHLPISAHLFPEVSVHLLASCHVARPLEWVTWMTPLLAESVLVQNGVLTVPNRPGLGIAFDREAVQRHRLE